MKYEVPVWEKCTLTIEEAAAYFGIGQNKLRELTEDPQLQVRSVGRNETSYQAETVRAVSRSRLFRVSFSKYCGSYRSIDMINCLQQLNIVYPSSSGLPRKGV